MTLTQTEGTRHVEMKEGDDWVCPNCACEIRLRHHGDPAKMQQMTDFTCCCGTKMNKEQRSS